MRYRSLILTGVISLTAWAGDRAVFQSARSGSHVYRGAADNLLHAALGLLSALLFLGAGPGRGRGELAAGLALCTAVSSLIDFDHFIVARSIYWKDLKDFKHRGILHCSSVWFGASILLIAWSQMFKKADYEIAGWMLLIAFTSHHVRDGNRRGLWLWPFGHTKPLDRNVYLLLMGLMPNLFYYVYKYLKADAFRYGNIDDYIV